MQLTLVAMAFTALLGIDNGDPNVTPSGNTDGKRMSVEEAVQIACRRQPGLLAARARMEAASSAAKSQRGRLLPSLHVNASQSWYKSDVYVSRTLLGSTDPNVFKAFPNEMSVGMVTLAAAQPLLGLVHLIQDYQSLSNSADASVENLRASEAMLRAEVKTYFLRMFEAHALGDTALASQKDLEEQVSMAQRKVDVGSLTTADVLRLQVAAATAKQQTISAQAQETSMRAALTEILGLPDDTAFAEPTSLHEIAQPDNLETAKEDALRQRPEIAARKLSARAAKQHANATSWALLPEIDVSASYIWAGIEPMNYQNKGVLDAKAGSIGISAKWPIWEWGASYYNQDRAQAEAQATAFEAQEAIENIRIEVAARRSDLVAALSNVEVAQVQVASAEEAYRVMQALMNAGSATTTDLLDAQAALTSARMNLVHAHYEAAVASIALQRATGADSKG